MTPETKNCQNCKQEFVIEPEDFDFYKKIDVPPPTWCPECRLQRRLAYRNERKLYKDNCDLCGKSMLSMYSANKPFKVYCKECWYSDNWDPMEFGADYDWQKPFIEQYKDLILRTPRINLFLLKQKTDVEYANFIVDSKEIYLSYSIVNSEEIYYSKFVDRSKNCFDCFNVDNSEKCYECLDCWRNYQCRYAIRSRECLNSSFIFDCANCQNCCLSSGLRNRQYVFRNKQLDKNTYEEEIRKMNMGSARATMELKKELAEIIRRSIHKFANIVKSTDCTGDNIENSKNVRRSFDLHDAQDAKFCMRMIAGAKDVYDVIGGASELVYDGVAYGFGSYNSKFCTYCDTIRNSFFSDWCLDNQNLFGCVSLRKKQYCILNKQYSKEEYFKLLPEIIAHMDKMPYKDTAGRVYKFGEFSPISMSQWGYNETVAQEYFPLSKEQALAAGYAWHDSDPYPYKWTIEPENLPDSIDEVDDKILEAIIHCPNCERAYRVIKAELIFLKQNNIPLPQKCPDCRYKDLFNMRNPFKLWKRSCMCKDGSSNETAHGHGKIPCPNTFETSYAPERPETVYCEQCYNAEIA